MLDKYKDSQKLFFNYITNCFNNDKLSHAYLIETNDVEYGYDLALDLAKFFLCNGTYDDKVCKLIDKNSYPNFMLIDSENIIKKESILDLQKMFSYKSIDNSRKVYLIKDASLLNDASANSLLKFLEEPTDDIIAILVSNSVNEVKSTLVSRCQIINLVNDDSFDYRHIFDYILKDNDLEDKDKLIENEYKLFLNFYFNIENEGNLVLRDRGIYDLTAKLDSLFKFGIYLYFDLINVILDNCRDAFLPDSDIKKKILGKNELKTLIEKVNVLNKYAILNKYNVNKNLFLDNFVIKFGGVSE